MSAGNKKRKRTESSGEPPAKLQVVEKNDEGNTRSSDAKSRAASRQAKSERRSKKPPKSASLLSQAEKLPQSEAPLVTSKSDTVDSDTLANGEDFVSLSVDPEQTFKSKPDGKTKLQPKTHKKSKAKATDPLTASTTPSTETKSKKDRFILFIGNLPYAATIPSITTHFGSLQPFTVRHGTDKATGRSKGFAFLEFESYDKLKTCIKLYHHSIFDPDHQPKSDQSPEQEDFTSKRKSSKHSKDAPKPGNPNPFPKSKNARRINVELTAGGGGSKSESRKDRIKQKNQKLSEQRERQHEKEAAEKAKLAQEKRARPASGANADQEDQGDGRGNVHPSRMQRVAH